MKWKNQQGIEISTADCIRNAVREAPDYNDGTLERLSAQIDKLTDIVGDMVSMLSESQQRELITKHNYEVKEVK